MSEPKPPQRLRDPKELAKLIADMETNTGSGPIVTADGRNLAAVLLGRQGGLKGGKARADALTPEKRREIAQLAARTRWKKKGSE